MARLSIWRSGPDACMTKGTRVRSGPTLAPCAKETAPMTSTLNATGAARAVDARKSYGTGEAAVHALAGVTVTFPERQFTASRNS